MSGHSTVGGLDTFPPRLAYLLVQRVQEEAGLVGHRPGPQRRVGGERRRRRRTDRETEACAPWLLRQGRADFWFCPLAVPSDPPRAAQKFRPAPAPRRHFRGRPSRKRRRLLDGRDPGARAKKGTTGHTNGQVRRDPAPQAQRAHHRHPGHEERDPRRARRRRRRGFKRIDVSQLAKEQDMLEEFDEAVASSTHVIDEDKVLDHMEEHGLGGDAGGVVVDYHGCDLFPERWFDLVVVLTCDNTVLYDRLQALGYSERRSGGAWNARYSRLWWRRRRTRTTNPSSRCARPRQSAIWKSPVGERGSSAAGSLRFA